MNVNDLLGLLSQLFFIALGFLTAFDYLRHRDQTRRDIALMFGALAASFLIQIFVNVTKIQLKWLSTLGSIALVSQPFLLLRLVQYFQPVVGIVKRMAFIGMLLSWLALGLANLFPLTLQIVLLLAMIVYFAAIDGYAMVTFVRGALTTSGVVRQRLRFAAAGSGLLAGALLSIGFIAFLPSLRIGITSLILAMAIAAALSYYIGFEPPRWLLRTWQLGELRKFLLRTNDKPVNKRPGVAESLHELCQSASLAIGGMAAAIAQKDGSGKQWILRFVSNCPELEDTHTADDGLIGRAWRERLPMFISVSGSLIDSDKRLLKTAGADTLLIAPITTIDRTWGLLLVFLKYSSLFIMDDLELMALLAQQSAIFLENSALIEELYDYSEQLERGVDARTLELEKSREEYRRIVETAHEGIWQTGADDSTTFVNPRMAEMLGYTIEEMLARSGVEFLTEDAQKQAAINRERRHQGIKEQFEVELRRKDGTRLIGLVSSTPLTDEQGQFTGALAMVADITERKQAEERILKLNADLEQRVVERTAQLSAVNRELEAFSYSVSHDLRAPLRIISGFSQVLMEDYSDKLDEEGQRYLQRIRFSCQKMGQLIDALLQLSRLSRAALQFKQVNLSEMAGAIAAELREQNAERQVEFLIQDALVEKGDEGLLRVAMTNLLNNAWKFTSKQPRPKIEFGSTEQNGHRAYFIRDNGVGFDMAYASKLFGAFQRLHRVDEFEGTGIGLATVERIFHRHGGKIWAEAAVNQGATFYFTLQSKEAVNHANE